MNIRYPLYEGVYRILTVISALKTNVPSIALTMLTPKAAGFPISLLNLVATGEY